MEETRRTPEPSAHTTPARSERASTPAATAHSERAPSQRASSHSRSPSQRASAYSRHSSNSNKEDTLSHHVDARPATPTSTTATATAPAAPVRTSPDTWTPEQTIEMLVEDSVDDVLPPLDVLRAARAQLSERIRHHKDEQDSLALDLECHAGGSEIHHLAARVRRLERFNEAVAAHVSGTMTREVEHVLQADERHSEEEVAQYAAELQSRRDALFRRIAAVAEQPPRGREDNIRTHTKAVELQEMDRTALAHVSENENQLAVLTEKVKKFRTMKSRLEAELVATERQAAHEMNRMRQRVKRAQLDIARDTRQCQELNTRNATLTTTAQMLMSQLNAEHYGVEGAPTPQQLIEAYKEMADEDTISQGISDTHNNNNCNNNHNNNNNNHAGQSGSQRASAVRPPMVSVKTTASQRMREKAAREQRSAVRAGAERRRSSGAVRARA